MNYPKNIKRNLFGIGAIEIRPYLTSFEIDAILQKAQESADSYAIRKAIIDASVLTLCTDLNDFKGEEVEIETVDMYETNGYVKTITKFIKGYDTLMQGMADLSVKDVYKRFENTIEEFTNEFKNVDLNGQEERFKGVLKELEKVSKEKEEILNG